MIPLNTADGSRLLRRLGYRTESEVFTGVKSHPKAARHYVSALEPGYVVLALTKAGVPTLVWTNAGGLRDHVLDGQDWAATVTVLAMRGMARRNKSAGLWALSLVVARKYAPELLTQLFNPQDVARLLRKYDEKRGRRA